MSETDTPETDAEEFHEAITKDPVVDSSFARKLERERDKARREAEKYRQLAVKKSVMAGDLASDNRWIKAHLDQARKLAEYYRDVVSEEDPIIERILPWEKPDAETA